MEIRERAIEIAFEHLGKPYVFGGNGPDKFDCSGYLIHILSRTGVIPLNTDMTAQGIFDCFAGPPRPPEAGCLAFYGNSTAEITHCAMLIRSNAIIGANGGDIRKVSVEKLHYHKKKLIGTFDPYVEA